MLGGLITRRRAKCFLRRRPLGPFTKKEMARYRRFSVGMIFQNFNLIPTMTARRECFAGARVWWFAWPATTRTLAELLARVGLGDRLSTDLPNFPAASNSASRLRVRSRTIRKCCWRTSRLEISTRFARTSCLRCCARWSIRIRLTILMVTHDQRTGEQLCRSHRVDEGWTSVIMSRGLTRMNLIRSGVHPFNPRLNSREVPMSQPATQMTLEALRSVPLFASLD